MNAAHSEAVASQLSRRHPGHKWATLALDADGQPAQECDAPATVLWRRQEDRTSWMVRAIESLPRLQWLHTDVVGVERFPLADLARRNIVLTNGRGNFARPMAEWIVWAVLTAAKSAATLVRASDRREWLTPVPAGEVAGRTALFVGFGSVARAAADLLAPFEVDVVAARRHVEQDQRPPKALVTQAWRERLSSSDYLVLALPLTPETAGVVDRCVLTRLKPGAWIINVSRGELIDESALSDVLDSGRLGGAVLDSFDVEPLPPSSPLWGRENVIVLPHVTASSVQSRSRCDDLFFAQAARFAAKQPLANIVDLIAGY